MLVGTPYAPVMALAHVIANWTKIACLLHRVGMGASGVRIRVVYPMVTVSSVQRAALVGLTRPSVMATSSVLKTYAVTIAQTVETPMVTAHGIAMTAVPKMVPRVCPVHVDAA